MSHLLYGIEVWEEILNKLSVSDSVVSSAAVLDLSYSQGAWWRCLWENCSHRVWPGKNQGRTAADALTSSGLSSQACKRRIRCTILLKSLQITLFTILHLSWLESTHISPVMYFSDTFCCNFYQKKISLDSWVASQQYTVYHVIHIYMIIQ